MYRKIATKTDWKTLEMPEAHECFKLERKISGEELNNIRYGQYVIHTVGPIYSGNDSDS